MKPLRTALKLPRYCRRKPLKNGRWAYFFEPPTWARMQGCQIEAEALGQDYTAAVERAENVLLPAFDSWRTRGLTDMVPATLVPGSFDWLVSIFKAHQKWKEIDTKRSGQSRARSGGDESGPTLCTSGRAHRASADRQGFTGARRVTVYAPVAPLGWLVFAELPVDEAYAPLYQAFERSGALLLSGLVLALLAALFVA